MKNSLASKGLSLSSAQSISNLCNQRAMDITNKLNNLNNAEKVFTLNEATYVETQGNKLPSDVVELILEKARLHATQAFLMENIKAKDALIATIKDEDFFFNVPRPERGDYVLTTILREVGEKWGMDQLSLKEVNQFLSDESFAAHLGQFIHKGSPLEQLRKELPTLKLVEWINVKDGERTPVKVVAHHTIEQLSSLHENLAAKHRQFEQKVNFIKAKVKDAVTLENARIAKVNGEEVQTVNAYNAKVDEEFIPIYNAWEAEKRKQTFAFEEARNARIKAAAALKIAVDVNFQPVVDLFLKQLEEK